AAAPALRQFVFEGDHPVVEVEDAEPEPTVLLRHLGQSPIEALPARALADGFPSLAFPTSRLEIETCFDHRRYLGAFHMVDEAQLSLLLEPPPLPPQGAHGFRA